MILIDAGPLIALQDPDDADYEKCRGVASTAKLPWLTTLAVFAEAMHLLGNRSGWTAQNQLWQFFLEGALQLADLDRDMMVRAAKLMEKYSDLPMDLGDATLVGLAESLNVDRIFTLDDDFRVFRLHGKKAFEIMP